MFFPGITVPCYNSYMEMIDHLQELKYEKVGEHTFTRLIQKTNEYHDLNGKFIFFTQFIMELTIVLDETDTEIVDAYMKPLVDSKIRTNVDVDSVGVMFNELKKDLDVVAIADDDAILA